MSKDETEIEALIQAKGLTRPRLTPQDVDDTIKAETYTTLPSGKVMVCELTLRNGFTVRGEAAVVSKANFNEEVGRKISRENARNKVWEMEGYLLQQRLNSARELLRTSNLSIAEVAVAAGYGDSDYFSRLFREAMKQTPRDYRESVRGKLFTVIQ